MTEYNIPNLNKILDDLVTSSGAITALLITKEGHNISEGGDTGYLNTTALAALVAGMFSATREVARLVGESQFSILLQQGEKRHIHISLVTESVMMIIVFEDYKRIGIVRHQARKTGQNVYELLMASEDKKDTGGSQELSMSAFKEYALNLVDRIFET